ncbi:glycosyltransferase family 4 protein [Winogradskyella sp.]|nr:glycosyltransferase family 4 protein [Winogradskyella sp.]
MKIVHINLSYSSGFGYTENMLLKALAKLGHEVHLITTNTQIYWYENIMYKEVYEERLGPAITAVHSFEEHGVIIHRLPYFKFCPFKSWFHQFDQFGIEGIYQYLNKIKPDIIQCQEINLYSTFYAARYAQKNGVKLFTENHIHKSIFNPKRRILKQVYNYFNPFLREINKQTSICFPIAPDAEDLTSSFYKVPQSKIRLQSLGVDTDLFTYIDRQNRNIDVQRLRDQMNYKTDDIVVIYTGRFTEGKNPLLLAQAIDYLYEKGYTHFKGLFLGKGEKNYTAKINNCKGCMSHDFVPVHELAAYYWASDIGVWPFQESMSQIDALSTGLPLVLSDTIEVKDRIEGNGYLYREGDFKDLANQLLKLKDKGFRIKLGKHGASRVESEFSWDTIAKIRTDYYRGVKK